MPSGTIQSRKGLQNKSQFRTIAPKIVPKVLPSRVPPGPWPPLSDQVNPGPSVGSTPLGVPAPNYTLMQVAGQKGTFSLVALPQVASAQPVQKPRLPLPENLKLPIPRYQPLRNNKGSTKNPVLSSSESGCSKPAAQTQTSPSPPGHSEPLPQPSPSKPGLSPDHPASISMTSGGVPGHSRPPVARERGDPSLPDIPAPATPEGASARQGRVKISGEESFASRETSSEPAAVASEKRKEQVDLAKGTIRLPPATEGSALQPPPSVPRGKLPVLPCLRVKTAEGYKSESGVNIADFSLPGFGLDWDKTSTIAEGFDAATKMASKVPGPQVSKQSLCKGAFCPATKMDLSHKIKLKSGAAKRKGRKLKGPDEILSFQGKRRRCKRIKNDCQQSRDQKPGAVKKYRSIMPKPATTVLTAAPLAPPAAVAPSPRPSSPGQAGVFSNSLAPQGMGCKQDGSPSPTPSSAFRNGISGIKKPWHRCPVCNHHFQFKQHLREHMNTHTNRRPYCCRVCRKAYVRPGSLSAHVQLHHSENRLKKPVCCEFCAKVFGHVRIYLGHLKEVHRVVISTEPSPSELQPGDLPRGRGATVQRESKSSLEEEDLLLNQADEVKLQIKCGRCQITAQSFAEIKFHLLYVHGEEIQGRLQETVSPGSQVALEELAPRAAPWGRCPQRREPQQPLRSEEGAHAAPGGRQPSLPHQSEQAAGLPHQSEQAAGLPHQSEQAAGLPHQSEQAAGLPHQSEQAAGLPHQSEQAAGLPHQSEQAAGLPHQSEQAAGLPHQSDQAAGLPHQSEQAAGLPHQSEQAAGLPHQSEQAAGLPHQSEQAAGLPHQSEQAAGLPHQSEQAAGLPHQSEQAAGLPHQSEQAAGLPHQSEQAAGLPHQSEQAAGLPHQSEQAAGLPHQSEQAAGLPHQSEQAAGLPHQSEQAAGLPHQSEQAAGLPHQSEQAAGLPHQSEQAAGLPHQSEQAAGLPHQSEQAAGLPHQSEQAAGLPHQSEQAAGLPHQSEQAAGLPHQSEQAAGLPHQSDQAAQPPSPE